MGVGNNNLKGIVIVGGMNTVVNLKEMEDISAFDYIGVGAGENIISDLVENCQNYPRVVRGAKAKGMGDWPAIDRNLWPKPHRWDLPYPAENNIPSWNPGPIATILTSKVCPWRCSFCNEASYIENLPRRPVDRVIEDLNEIDEKHGPIGSVVIHDSMFFQHPSWLEEWAEKYPRKANKVWPYWAAARADTVRKWPELFKRLVVETNWNVVSIGLESGSDASLLTLNKECTVQDNLYAISLINHLGDALEASGRTPVRLFSNIMFGLPGETREDIFETIKMISFIKRAQGLLSPSLYAPYPGAALGYQLIAEGKSLIGAEKRDRTPDSKKLSGVDYDFINECLMGLHNEEALRDRVQWMQSKSENGTISKIEKFNPVHSFYLFDMKNGKSKIAWGPDPQAAIEGLKRRLTDDEFSQIAFDRHQKIVQSKLPSIVHQLG